MYSLVLGACLLFSGVAYGQPSGDLITDLPGVTWTLGFDQYSGYLDLSNGHHLHYWLTESQSGDAANDPLVLWLNGGPGCSSLDGLLYELGPIRVNHDGTLYENKYAWNLNANVIFLEAPICVGFSYSDSSRTCQMTDNTTADDNYNALLQFFSLFPNYVNRPFFVTGESYGGVYVPTLVRRILTGNQNNEGTNINLQAFAVGNGILSADNNDNSAIWLAYHHGFVDETLWNSLMSSCCVSPYTRSTCYFANPSKGPNHLQCATDVNVVMGVIYNGYLNWYNIYGDCINTDQVSDHFSFDKYIRTLENIHTGFHKSNGYKYIDQLKERQVKSNVPCIDATGADIYLNTASVKAAIHVKSSLTWGICSSTLYYTSQYPDLSPVFQDIFSMDSSIWSTVYNGDTDFSCNFLGDEWFSLDLGFTAGDSYHEWFLNTTSNGVQVGGWTINYPRLSFVTIRGSGHMAPQFRPQESLVMYEHFLTHAWL